MASRRRARRFSLQILYALDNHARQLELDFASFLEGDEHVQMPHHVLPPVVKADLLSLASLSGEAKEEATRTAFVKALSLCADQQMEYLWYLQLEQNTLDAKKVPPFKGIQRIRFEQLLQEHVRIEEAVSLALDSSLYRQYETLSACCHLPPYVAYWVVKHQSDVLAALASTDLSLEDLGQLLQHVVEGGLLESQLLNLINRYLEAHRVFVERRRENDEEAFAPTSPLCDLELKPVEKRAFEGSLSLDNATVELHQFSISPIFSARRVDFVFFSLCIDLFMTVLE